MKYQEFVQESPGSGFEQAKKIVKEIYEYICLPEIKEKIASAHKFNAKSHDIQDIFLPKCIDIGMSSEKKGLFDNHITTRLRPDYYIPIGESGLIMEVERGKTTANNMDLLDIWKCHLCDEADYLLLVVPVLRQSSNGRNQKIFEHVVNRVGTFFFKRNYVNVKGCFIIGYE